MYSVYFTLIFHQHQRPFMSSSKKGQNCGACFISLNQCRTTISLVGKTSCFRDPFKWRKRAPLFYYFSVLTQTFNMPASPIQILTSMVKLMQHNENKVDGFYIHSSLFCSVLLSLLLQGPFLDVAKTNARFASSQHLKFIGICKQRKVPKTQFWRNSFERKTSS